MPLPNATTANAQVTREIVAGLLADAVVEQHVAIVERRDQRGVLLPALFVGEQLQVEAQHEARDGPALRAVHEQEPARGPADHVRGSERVDHVADRGPSGLPGEASREEAVVADLADLIGATGQRERAHERRGRSSHSDRPESSTLELTRTRTSCSSKNSMILLARSRSER